jgi:hypothetical protein
MLSNQSKQNDKSKNINKLSNIRQLKKDTIYKKHKQVFNMKSQGKTLKKTVIKTISKSPKQNKNLTKKHKIILND